MRDSYPEIERFCERFGAAIVIGDYAAAHAALAPWLAAVWTPERLEGLVAAQLSDLAEVFDLEAPPALGHCGVDSNSLSLDTLRDEAGAEVSSGEFPDEITEANYRAWMCVELGTSDAGGDRLGVCDLWVAVVEVDGELGVGYFEALEPD
jgi:hypothetical protein